MKVNLLHLGAPFELTGGRQSDTPPCFNNSRLMIAPKEVRSGKMKKVAVKLNMDTKHFFVIAVTQ